MSIDKKEAELKKFLKMYVNHQTSLSESEAIDYWYDALDLDETNSRLEPITDSQLEHHIKEYLFKHIGKKRPQRKYLSYAAACLILLTTALVWSSNQKPKASMKAHEMRITAGIGARKEITLTDGSIVMLNAGSQLLVAADFGEKDRKVSLSGEAYFKIAKDKNKPFLVQSGLLRTSVLGTSFNINAYPERDRIKVAVLTGRVMVSQLEGKQFRPIAKNMTVNKTVSFYKSTGKYEINTEDALAITSWKDAKLFIDNASIKDISEQLKRHYNLKVNDLSKSNAVDRYTIRFNHESINSVLRILTRLTDRQFIYQYNQITIKNKNM